MIKPIDILGLGNGVSDNWNFTNASEKATRARFEHGERPDEA